MSLFFKAISEIVQLPVRHSPLIGYHYIGETRGNGWKLWAHGAQDGGERGIRTLAPRYRSSCLAGKRFRPLSHLSKLYQRQ